MRAYVFVDTLTRVLEYNGYDVRHVMNITDVGHLTSDEDAGEDKIEKTARAEGKQPIEIANHYLQLFHDDCAKTEYRTADGGMPCNGSYPRDDCVDRADYRARLRVRHAVGHLL